MHELTPEKKNEIKTAITESRKNELKESHGTEAKQIVDEMHKAAMVQVVANNEEIKQKVISKAEQSIENELESLNQEEIKRKQETTYNANEEACNNYGINKQVPIWQIRLMRLGSGFWFIIYFVFASLTIAPVNIFFKGIKHFIKNNIIVFIFSIISYLVIVVGIPLIIKFIGGI